MSLIRKLGWAVVLSLGVFLAARMAVSGAWLLAAAVLAAVAFPAWVYNSPRAKASRYLLPGLAAFTLFVVMPLLYTVCIAFTNYGGGHLLSRDRVDAWFAQEEFTPSPERFSFRVHALPDDPSAPGGPPRYQLVATPVGPDGAAALAARPGDFAPRAIHSAPFTAAEARSGDPIPLNALNISPPAGPRLTLREIVAARPWLRPARFKHPSVATPLRAVTLRELAPRLPLWTPSPDGRALTNAQTGATLVADPARGNYVDPATGLPVGPGWRVPVGFANYRLLFADPAVRGPFLRVFGWNVAFAFLSVALTFAVGVLLASLLQWKALRFRAVYRTLLILPYAIPAFIPILVFKGLFNEGFGEINLILSSLFGIAPHWFTNPWLARLMILIVNTWLGYPYMMIIASGMLQAVPDELYEATAMDGAGPWSNFWHVTLPQIFPPLFPLLIASFAFNFNNFSLIYLLTGGKPDIVGSTTGAGTTDLLVSYTFRMAFKDSASRFGFASAVATILFLVVAVLAVFQLRASRRPAAAPRR